MFQQHFAEQLLRFPACWDVLLKQIMFPRFFFIDGSLIKHGAAFCSFPCLRGPLGTVGLFSPSGRFPCVFPMGRAPTVVLTLEYIMR